MKIDAFINRNPVKSYDIWRKDLYLTENEDRMNFSSELLLQLRDNIKNVDIRDVRELLALGADPNYILLGHTDEEKIIAQIQKLDYDEARYAPRMRMIRWNTLALSIYRQEERPDILKELFNYGANPNLDLMDINLANSPSAFFFSATRRMKKLYLHESILDMFVKKGANVNIENRNGDNVIHACVDKGRFAIIPKLIELGVDPYKRNNEGELPYDLLDQQVINAMTGMSYYKNEDNPDYEKVKELLKPKSIDSKKTGSFIRK